MTGHTRWDDVRHKNDVRRLLAERDRLSFVRTPHGFVAISHDHFAAEHGEELAVVVDGWVEAAGGEVQTLPPPQSRGLRAGRPFARAQATTVWRVPRSRLDATT